MTSFSRDPMQWKCEQKSSESQSLMTRNIRRLKRVSREKDIDNMSWRIDVTGRILAVNKSPSAVRTCGGDGDAIQVQGTITFPHWANFDSELNGPFDTSPRHCAPLCPPSSAGNHTSLLPHWMGFMSLNFCIPDPALLTHKTICSSSAKMGVTWTTLLHALFSISRSFLGGERGAQKRGTTSAYVTESSEAKRQKHRYKTFI